MFVIQFAMNGSCKELGCRVFVAGELNFFTISGYKNTNTKNQKEEQYEKIEGNSTREEGYFSFEIKVPTSQVILADHKVKKISKNYGSLNLEFDLLDENS